jgi:hypothetical protein
MKEKVRLQDGRSCAEAQLFLRDRSAVAQGRIRALQRSASCLNSQRGKAAHVHRMRQCRGSRACGGLG